MALQGGRCRCLLLVSLPLKGLIEQSATRDNEMWYPTIDYSESLLMASLDTSFAYGWRPLPDELIVNILSYCLIPDVTFCYDNFKKPNYFRYKLPRQNFASYIWSPSSMFRLATEFLVSISKTFWLRMFKVILTAFVSEYVGQSIPTAP